MHETNADWIDTLTADQRRNACHHLRDLIDLEIGFPMNVLSVLGTLPAHEFHPVVTIFERMNAERLALARCRER